MTPAAAEKKSVDASASTKNVRKFKPNTPTINQLSSPHVIWQIVRRNSSFLKQRDGAVFTSEPNNLTGKNSWRFSGLAHKRPVGMRLIGDSGHNVALETRYRGNKKARKPSKMMKRMKLNKDKEEMKRVEQALVGYRTDLLRVARRRFRKLRATGTAGQSTQE